MLQFLFEQLCESILKSDYGSRITEDELYQKVISIKPSGGRTLGIWISPERDMYYVHWHEPFIRDVMREKYRKDPNYSKLMKELDKDFYKFAFVRGWVRLNITESHVVANGYQDGMEAMTGQLNSLAKSLDRQLLVDVES